MAISMIVIFMVVHYFATFKNILRYTDYHQLLKFINSFLEIIALIAINWFVLKALKYSEFFKGINIELKLVKDFPVERGKETIKDREEINENYVPKFQTETLTIYMTDEALFRSFLNSATSRFSNEYFCS